MISVLTTSILPCPDFKLELQNLIAPFVVHSIPSPFHVRGGDVVGEPEGDDRELPTDSTAEWPP